MCFCCYCWTVKHFQLHFVYERCYIKFIHSQSHTKAIQSSLQGDNTRKSWKLWAWKFILHLSSYCMGTYKSAARRSLLQQVSQLCSCNVSYLKTITAFSPLCPAVLTDMSELTTTPRSWTRLFCWALTFSPRASVAYGKGCSLKAAKNLNIDIILI